MQSSTPGLQLYIRERQREREQQKGEEGKGEGGGEKEGDKDSSHVWTRNWRSEMNLFSRWQHHCWDEWCAKIRR